MYASRALPVIGLLVSAALLSACASRVTESDQYSGFLADYSQLKPVSSPSGKPTLRWISPDFHSADYRAVMVDPVVYYPAAKPSARVSQATLDQLRSYTDAQLRAAAARHKPLVSQRGPGVLELKTAITAVNAENQDMKFYEVVPVAAVIASTMAATGHRTQNSALYLELQLVDAQTGKPQMTVVRKAYGKSVANSSAPVTFPELQQGVDEMIRDATDFPAVP